MPLNTVRTNNRNRFADVLAHLVFIESLEPSLPTDPTPIQVKMLRGLYYVHLYAALEKTVNEAVEQTLLLINGKQVENRHFQSQFNIISLHPKIQSLKDAGYKTILEKSVDVFSSIDSSDVFNINNTVFSKLLQNVWHKTLDGVLKCFGIPGFTIDPRLVIVVNEIVEKRNAVAHGRESPVAVGERHRSTILRPRTQDIQMVSDLFIDALETHLINKDYIKPPYKATY